MRRYCTKELRPKLQDVVDKSEGEFEKKIVYIASGALGLSFAFISDIVDLSSSILLVFLCIGWGLLIICICLNLWSQITSKQFALKTIDDIDNEAQKENFNYGTIKENIDDRNKITDCINRVTTWSMVIGIAFILTFAIVNIISVQNKSIEKHEQIENNMKETDNPLGVCINHLPEPEGFGYRLPHPEVNSTVNTSNGGGDEHTTTIDTKNDDGQKR